MILSADSFLSGRKEKNQTQEMKDQVFTEMRRDCSHCT